MKLALLFVALPLAAQIHIEACSAADQGFSLPSTCYTSPMALPAGAPAYLQKERYGTFNYHFAVADGSYAVTLHFIENSTAITGPGQRVFAVGIGSAIVIPSLDLFATAGLNVPVDRGFTATAAGGTGLIIGFATIVRNAVVSAIDITPLPGALTATSLTIISQYAAGMVFNGVDYLLPTDPSDSTGKVIKDQGAVPCTNVDPVILKLGFPCHQIVWALPGQ